MTKAIEITPGADKAVAPMCEFYKHHIVAGDPRHDLSQYVSLALYLGDPPAFTPKLKDGRFTARCGSGSGHSFR